MKKADLKPAAVTLHGEGEAAGVALYAALFEPAVAGLDLWQLPPTHRQGPAFLNVLRHLDMPQAVALALPRKVTLHVKTAADAAARDWPRKVGQAAGGTITVKIVGG